jgi:hypothetical protein
VLLVVFFYSAAIDPNGQSIDEVDMCSLYKSREACSGADLPALWFEWASNRSRETDSALTVDGWQCKWLESVATISKPCVRENCNANGRLDARKVSIVSEFLGLVLGAYGLHFAIWTVRILDLTAGQVCKLGPKTLGEAPPGPEGQSRRPAQVDEENAIATVDLDTYQIA